MTAERITDFSLWDLQEEFNDYEVAYLWLDLEPSYGNDHPSKVIGFRNALSQAKSRGELDCRDNSGRHIYRDKYGRECGMFVQDIPRYQRQSLRNWAEKKGQRPLFLFPEFREIKPEQNNSRLVEANDNYPKGRDQHSVKNLIAAMATLLHGSINWSYDVDSYARELLEDFSNKGIDEPLEIRTLTKWLNKAAATLEKK